TKFGGGPKLFKVVYDNVLRRRIEVRYETAAISLISEGQQREVLGVAVRDKHGKVSRVKASHGVILACGGFEGNDEMRQQWWEGLPIGSAMAKNNTGDGIRMTQELGAQLWHMWHFHGSYGFKHPEAQYPYIIRSKRLPNWKPGREHLAQVKMAWIIVDRPGRRYMNEYHPYVQDTNHRPMHYFDPVSQSYPRIPSFLICDEKGRKLYPLGAPTYNDPDVLHYEWSADNLREVEAGILTRADTISALGRNLGIKDPAALTATIARWNEMCANQKDGDFGRPAGTMLSIDSPPYYGGEIWPVVSNTQGGPVHNRHHQVINVNGEPIPRLYAVGELGSAFGHLYSAGGNLAECFISGRVAARHVTGLNPW
ncbi:MAG TPA: FAD-binding protein, partial [Candidatus Binataceae bacterium]|nr:FAD-binding protein [Candidatus Binataceae bacterium]